MGNKRSTNFYWRWRWWWCCWWWHHL